MHKFKSSLVVLAAAIMLPAAAQAQTKITIGIPTSPPNIVHMPAIVAKDLGLYKKAGLDVDIVSLGDGDESLSCAARGQYRVRAHAWCADDYRPLEWRGGESAVRQSAEI